MKIIKRTAAALLVVALCLVMAGCGINAKDYTTESLNYSFKGIITEEYAKMTNKTVEELKEHLLELRKSAYESFIGTLGYSSSEINEQSFAKVKDTFEKIYGSVRYEVVSTKQTEGGYEATVELYPLKVSQIITNESLTAALLPVMEKYKDAGEITGDNAVAVASELSDVIMDLYISGLKDAQYGDKQTVILNLTVNDRIISLGEDQILMLEKLLFA